ncbi:unnamed protein product [Fraxinus pennsylvanica]|uniref:Small ribosomal subunit protein uS5 C-terminal domain-containing protein n=1 Tax=Fraxinus pennsylvanica TaxID=56036 RepID=A0AAD2AG21_9LAMI|nr:unnamed protein product [Fraxinus pennsylvanica]
MCSKSRPHHKNNHDRCMHAHTQPSHHHRTHSIATAPTATQLHTPPQSRTTAARSDLCTSHLHHHRTAEKFGSVTVRMVPAARGAGILAARVPKKVFQFAGIEDVFTSSRGSTKTLGNFVKATFDCLLKTCGFLTPDFWRETRISKSPFREYTDLLARPPPRLSMWWRMQRRPKFTRTEIFARMCISQNIPV